MDKPFWENTYKSDDAATFGVEPSRNIKAIWKQFEKGWQILDVGCGEGRDSIFLAGQGFKVDAFDVSEAGIAKVQRISADKNVKLNAWVQDLTQFQFNKSYDVITTHGALHLVEREQWYDFIMQMKANTNAGGMNIIGIFTNKLPATPDNAPFTKGLFNEGELKTLYEDWEIIHQNARVFEDEHPGGIKHKHASENIIARKPG
jgi:tellurite methyltransferase